MFKYSVRRCLTMIPTLLGVITLIFLVVRVIPGDPASSALGDYASKGAVDALRERMGLNQPILQQYFKFLLDLLQGNLGKSMITGESVVKQISFVLPYSLELTLFSVILGIIVGIPVGIYTALKRNKLVDHLGRLFSLTGLSMPAFYLGILLLWVFSIKLRLFPVIGGGDPNDLFDRLQYLALPCFALGLIMTASVTRLTRSTILNVLTADYIRTARAKGLSEWIVLFRHVLRSALVPILSIIGIWIIGLIGSSVTTEIVFARPGMGKFLVGAILQRDYTTVQSVMVIYASIVAIVNLLTDLAYGFVDPRIRY